MGGGGAATDVVVGFGPMLLVPTALTFTALAAGSIGSGASFPVWIQLAEHVAHRWLTALGLSASSSAAALSEPRRAT